MTMTKETQPISNEKLQGRLKGNASFTINVFELSKPFENPETEMLRATVAKVEEVDTDNDEALSEYARLYLAFLKKESNRQHFTGIPEDVDEFKADLKKNGNHGLAVFNVLGQVVGFAVIGDAEKNQNDSFLNKFVIVNSLQNKRQDDKPKHVGRQALEKIAEWVFTTPMYDGRQRESLHAAVVMKVPNAQRMDDLLTHYGFRFVSRLENQATVSLYDGQSAVKPVERFALDRSTWETKQILKSQIGSAEVN